MLTRRDLLKTLSFLFANSVASKNSFASSLAAPEEDLTQYVNPMIGTGGHGHTYPGATVPFGMVQLSPDNGVNGWDWCSGYNYSSNEIVGFSHTHLSGTGIGDMLDISFMPFITKGEMPPANLKTTFKHENERASAGYYSVKLDNNIQVELTATERVGFHHYQFPLIVDSGQRATIVIDLGSSFNWDTPTETFMEIDSTYPFRVKGYRKSTGWAKNQCVYFVADIGSFSDVKFESDGNIIKGTKAKGKKVRGAFFFQPDVAIGLEIQVGISATSIEGALRNLQTEAKHQPIDSRLSFLDAKESAKKKWNDVLRRVRLKTNNRKQKTVFYTALYHSMLAPTLFCDFDGAYRGADSEIHALRNLEVPFYNYTTFSLWDTFRAAHPLHTILQPERVDAMVQSMMAFYREHGLLPVWSLMSNETNTMIGYHSIPVIVDAIQKGLTKINEHEAFEAMKKSALQDAHGLRYYKMPEPTTLEKLYKTLERDDIKPIENQKPFEFPTNFVAGYAKTISGATIGYHSAHANVNQALIARTQKDKNIIEWETASVPVGSKRKEVSFVWLAGIDVDQSGRRYDFYVNNEKWFEFHNPKEASQTSFQVKSANGATLSFYATHIDRFGDFFGYMTLTVPIETVSSEYRLQARKVFETQSPKGTLNLKVIGADENDDDWFMTFEHSLGNRITASNVYALVDLAESSNEPEKFKRLADLSGKDLFIFQAVRIDIENTDTRCKAKIDIDLENENKESSVQASKRSSRAFQETRKVDTTFDLNVGANHFFFPIKRADTNKNCTIKINKDNGQTLTQPFTLRPVKPFNYIPADLENESVSKTLEYAYDDWCIAQLAKKLNRQEDYKLFTERAQFYKNLFDKETGFMRGKLSDGSWKVPFSPKFSSHRQDEYTEGNAWQYSWFVPHDVEGMIKLFGGRDAFIKKLDQLFTESSQIEGTSASPDISGLIGQYAHGNEPSHHIAYLYTLAGAHHKTENVVRQITSTLYNDTPEGLCGNEDCGQMSAWYIFSALGFYPVNPASSLYVLGTPHFEKVDIDVGDGKVFSVIANGLSDTNRYVQSVSLNGKTLHELFIKHQDIMQGGKLVFEMGVNKKSGFTQKPIDK